MTGSLGIRVWELEFVNSWSWTGILCPHVFNSASVLRQPLCSACIAKVSMCLFFQAFPLLVWWLYGLSLNKVCNISKGIVSDRIALCQGWSAYPCPFAGTCKPASQYCNWNQSAPLCAFCVPGCQGNPGIAKRTCRYFARHMSSKCQSTYEMWSDCNMPWPYICNCRASESLVGFDPLCVVRTLCASGLI